MYLLQARKSTHPKGAKFSIRLSVCHGWLLRLVNFGSKYDKNIDFLLWWPHSIGLKNTEIILVLEKPFFIYFYVLSTGFEMLCKMYKNTVPPNLKYLK